MDLVQWHVMIIISRIKCFSSVQQMPVDGIRCPSSKGHSGEMSDQGRRRAIITTLPCTNASALESVHLQLL